MLPIISHLRKDSETSEWIIQTNEEHSTGVASFASKFAGDFGMASWGEALGYLHDLGKGTNAFQNYIRYTSGYDTSVRPEGDTHHAMIGALIAKDIYPKDYVLLVNPIIGHHRGLYDFSDLSLKLQREKPEEITIPDITLSSPLSYEKNIEDFHHVIRMLFSCLVDADYLDTERFMNPDSFNRRSREYTLKPLLERLEKYLSELNSSTTDSPVNQVRQMVQQYSRDNSGGKPYIYEMTVPTGGGKTLSSLLWALRHAVNNDLRRIIIAIPFTSIIEQTAFTLKSIFGEENVLEHHSQVTRDSTDDKELSNRIALASENWDYPIIVTTNVRLFESMFHHKPSRCRRLHNLAKSVIIMDEVQTLPLSLYDPILQALNALHRTFGSSILLTTASQPVLCGTIRGCNPLTKCDGLTHKPIPIIPHDESLWRPLRRVDLVLERERYTYDAIASRLSTYRRVLCIVNKRISAREIHRHLPASDSTIHLSKMMCPAHLKQQLAKIKQLLSDPSNEIRVIATQLIEAGVDVDFPIVFRQEAGLDSIIQAAGRCNREGKLAKKGKTFVFSLSEPNSIPAGFLTKANDARRDMGEINDWFSDEAMEIFFKKLHARINTFDHYQTQNDLIKYHKFQTASENFKYIDNEGQPVIVNWDKSMRLLEQYKESGPNYHIIKALSQYSVSITQAQLIQLRKLGLVEEVDNLFVVTHPQAYDEQTGLSVDNEWLDEPMIF